MTWEHAASPKRTWQELERALPVERHVVHACTLRQKPSATARMHI